MVQIQTATSGLAPHSQPASDLSPPGVGIDDLFGDDNDSPDSPGAAVTPADSESLIPAGSVAGMAADEIDPNPGIPIADLEPQTSGGEFDHADLVVASRETDLSGLRVERVVEDDGEPEPAVALPAAAVLSAADATADDGEETDAPDPPESPEVHAAMMALCDATCELVELEAEQDSIKRRIKEQKEHVDDCARALAALRSDADDANSPFSPPMGAPASGANGNGKSPGASPQVDYGPVWKEIGDELKNAAPPLPSDAWRYVSLLELKPGTIKGMGKAKINALVALCPTLGAFEDLRAEASMAHKPLHSMLPKGIGKDMADELESLQVDWLANNFREETREQTAAAVDQQSAAATDQSEPPAGEATEAAAEPEQPEQQPEPAADPAPAPAPDPAADPIAAPIADPATYLPPDTEPLDQVTARGEEFYAILDEATAAGQPGQGIADLRSKITSQQHAEDGRNAYLNGESFEACIWEPGEQQDNWLLGYIVAQALDGKA